MKYNLGKTLLFSITLFATQLTFAGVYDEGFAAYNRNDYAAAFKEWHSLAEQGDARAQAKLGSMYADGQGVIQDYQQAAVWYRKAAQQGDVQAQVLLGIMYTDGQGVIQDYQQAAVWYRKAAEQGNAPAQGQLGIMYAKGQGVTQDYQQAVVWFHKAAEQGYEPAQALFSMYAKGLGNSDQAQSIQKYLANNFGIPELMASWYPNIIGISIKGDTVIVQTSLSSVDEKVKSICMGTSSYVFSTENSSVGLQNIQVVGANAEVLIDRRGIGDTCS